MERWRIVKAFTLGPLLEAVIPKPGNVNRFADFRDLSLYHFLFGNTAVLPVYYEAVETGELVRKGIIMPNEAGIGELIKRAVSESRKIQDANPNFGVITLSIPLMMGLAMARNIMEGPEKAAMLIRESTVRDTMELYRAIRIANPKGIPSGVKYDVYSNDAFRELFRDGINLWALAEMSCERELIFCEWINSYNLSYSTADLLVEELKKHSLEEAVVRVFLRILSEKVDTLIARKAGAEEAKAVMERAKRALRGEISLEEFDSFLREKGDLRNPGSIADIVAVATSLLVAAGLRVKVRNGKVFGVIGQP
ncbi:triphosphoribosyl-dephospho-CoA synthase [Thermococcus sp. Bubb.Bath]|uniref:triphosphoribosyl-dephospho-CoA synthase n=1 Tax=Thermococcus sp. Bubb.Bath TaxID=1638242 RepID=UPI00143A51DB|nr:triphosphoribosyl-dephospho-CoA synthase [Thermococcus sp. Bubb.Bath]NJF24780.1 apo-citrate lyase phosphoribosyl-dephospho-CoA transferase [Thermococcus sp. Bubb.Bath]